MPVNLPAIRFEAEAFRLGSDKILGRQSAGDAFLRAALALDGLADIHGSGPNTAPAQAFGQMVAALRKDVTAKWVPTHAHGALATIGTLHFPDPNLGTQALARLSSGSAAYSLSGVTHTISSSGVMNTLSEMATKPLMEWDGLICTSDAVKASVVELLDEQDDYLRWRLGPSAQAPRLQLPVIPLGVHCRDFTFDNTAKAEARKALGLGAGDVAFLFVGRLSFHAKANPFPMYQALEEAARRTGKRIALIQCGWFANDAIEGVFKQTAATHAPHVRHIWLDGRKAGERQRAWAAGDIFISLSDNIQETFGLTPLEAMAAGMPVIVSDWNGYRQTVQHNVCGLMVPSFAPSPPAGDRYAAAHADQNINYDHYLAYTARHISVDLAALFDATELLVNNAEKRKAFGEAGRRIAAETFDWAVVMGQYRTFWDELTAIRTKAPADDPHRMGRAYADRLNPYRLFANYPTHQLTTDSILLKRENGSDFAALLADPLFNQARNTLPPDDAFVGLLGAVSPEGTTLGAICAATSLDLETGLHCASMLAKMGCLTIA